MVKKEKELTKGFDHPLRCEKLLKRRWKVLSQFSYRDQYGVTYTVPRAYVTDLASVPRTFWWLYPPDGSYTQAAVLHDFLCEKRFLPHKQCHQIFKEAMEDLPGISKHAKFNMSLAVKWFGPKWKKVLKAPPGAMTKPKKEKKK